MAYKTVYQTPHFKVNVTLWADGDAWVVVENGWGYDELKVQILKTPPLLTLWRKVRGDKVSEALTLEQAIERCIAHANRLEAERVDAERLEESFEAQLDQLAKKYQSK